MSEPPAPFSSYRTDVRAEWLDYNGHMHDASYGIVLSEANEELLAALGLSAEYRARTGAALYTVEYHIRYLAECSLGQSLSADTIVVAADAKKLHLYTEILDHHRKPATTGESLYLHVDTTLATTIAMPQEQRERVRRMVAAHARLPRPAHLGLGVGAAHSTAEDR